MRFESRMLALVAVGLSVVALATAACSPPSAADLVREILSVRNEFDVELGSWLDRSDASGQPYIYLDMRVIKNTDEALDRLTIMTVQVDAEGNSLLEKRITVDVSDMTRGLAKTVNAELRPMAEGVDGIRVYIEENPPEETWPEFPELDRVRPRG